MNARAFLIGLAAGIFCPAQVVEQVPTFRAETTLVEFTIVALGSKGNPVTDLKKEEISVADNGRNRELSALRFDGAQTHATPALAPPAPLPPGAFSNRPEHTPAAVSR